jgi:hypothetical protein
MNELPCERPRPTGRTVDVRNPSFGEYQDRPESTDFVDKPDLERRRRGVGGGFREVKSGRCASSGEGRRRKRDELRQFPQILGGGR